MCPNPPEWYVYFRLPGLEERVVMTACTQHAQEFQGHVDAAKLPRGRVAEFTMLQEPMDEAMQSESICQIGEARERGA